MRGEKTDHNAGRQRNEPGVGALGSGRTGGRTAPRCAEYDRAGQGQTVAERCRSEGISEATFYRRKAQCGRREGSQLQRLRQLEDERS